MSWIYQGSPVTEFLPGTVAFVYCITRIDTGERYIGRKSLTRSRTQYRMRTTAAGVRRRTRIKSVTESDWADYWGSNTELSELVSVLGPEHFRREIIHQCKTVSHSRYLELYEQMVRGVLLDDTYYNRYVGARIHSNHVTGLRK